MKSVYNSEPVQQMRLFSQPKLTGFNLVRAFNTENQQDAAFQAIRGTIAACTATAGSIGRWGHNVLYIPVVVIDSPLLQCYLPADSENYELEEVSEGSVLYNTGTMRDVERSNMLTVHVLHIDALAQFIQAAKRDMKNFYKLARAAAPN
jgi:hypothetical protein